MLSALTRQLYPRAPEEPHGLLGDAQAAGRDAIVHVYDYASVSRATLAQAEVEATKIFNIAMIHLTWVGCRPRTIAMAGDSRCHPSFGSAHFILRILPRSEFTHPAFGERTLGFALPSTEVRGGTMATVFYIEVQNQSPGRRILFAACRRKESLIRFSPITHPILAG
jgi:hypothetical protein